MNLLQMAKSLFSSPKTPALDRVRYWCYNCYQIHELSTPHIDHNWNDFTIKCGACHGSETLIVSINGKSNVSD